MFDTLLDYGSLSFVRKNKKILECKFSLYNRVAFLTVEGNNFDDVISTLIRRIIYSIEDSPRSVFKPLSKDLIKNMEERRNKNESI